MPVEQEQVSDVGLYNPTDNLSGSTPTAQIYVPLQVALVHFNPALFNDRLPPCAVTLRASGNTAGFFGPNGFASLTDDGRRIDEIALNPADFSEKSPREVCSTLVHEMVHLEQEHFGRPGRRGYHNEQFAALMRRVGLQCTDTGEPGGKETGDHMDHIIIAGGRFDVAYAALERTGWKLHWGAVVRRKGKGNGPKPGRVKFACTTCSGSTYGKPTTDLCCTVCLCARLEAAGVSASVISQVVHAARLRAAAT